MKAKIVRAAAILYWYSPNRSSIVSFERHGILESVIVRDSAAYSSSARPREVYMRVSIAAGGRKTSRRDFFACFG